MLLFFCIEYNSISVVCQRRDKKKGICIYLEENHNLIFSLHFHFKFPWKKAVRALTTYNTRKSWWEDESSIAVMKKTMVNTFPGKNTGFLPIRCNSDNFFLFNFFKSYFLPSQSPTNRPMIFHWHIMFSRPKKNIFLLVITWNFI